MTRYIGNTGRFERIADAPARPRAAPPTAAPHAESPDGEAENVTRQTHFSGAAPRRVEPRGGVFGMLGALLGGEGGASPFGGALGGGGLNLPFGLELADVAIALLFLFLYLESGDTEFLIILACFAIGTLGIS